MTEENQQRTVPLLDYDLDDVLKWIGYHTRIVALVPSDAIIRCVGLLASWTGGTHHIKDHISIAKIVWDDDRMLHCTTRNTLSTFDFDNLTTLVFLAHDLLIRVEISPASNREIRLMLFPRHTRDGGTSQRHPTVRNAVDRWEKLR